jgi:5-methylcytosine-specific restriction endonuclease McrA
MAGGQAIKGRICRRFPELLEMAGRNPRDRLVIAFIVKLTGWNAPHKKDKYQFMLRFLQKYAGEPVPTALTKSQKKRASQPQRDRSKGFYMSDEWRALRYQVLKKFGATCQCCGATPKTGRQVHVDHIKPRSKYPELELEFSNLQVLCEDCNLGKLHLDETDWRPEEVEKLPEGAEEHLRSLN